jgi:hypothetical protein
MASSTPSATPDHIEVHRVNAAASKTFKHVVSVKLDDSNYLQWKQQVEGVLCDTKLVKYVVSPQIPPVFLNDADRESGSENPVYTEWEEQDSLLMVIMVHLRMSGCKVLHVHLKLIFLGLSFLLKDHQHLKLT